MVISDRYASWYSSIYMGVLAVRQKIVGCLPRCWAQFRSDFPHRDRAGRGHVPVRICGGSNDLGIMDDAGPWRAPRRQTRSAGGSPPTERSRPTIASIARRVDGAKFVILKSPFIHS